MFFFFNNNKNNIENNVENTIHFFYSLFIYKRNKNIFLNISLYSECLIL